MLNRNVMLIMLLLVSISVLQAQPAQFPSDQVFESVAQSYHSTNSGSDDQHKMPGHQFVHFLPDDMKASISNWQVIGSRKMEVKAWYANGNLAAHFTIKNHRLHGSWKSWFDNGKPKDEGQFVNGHPDGLWQWWYDNGVLRSERTYSADKLIAYNIAARQRNPKLQFYPASSTTHSSKELANIQKDISAIGAGLTIHELPFHHAVHHGHFANYARNGQKVVAGHYLNGTKDGQWLHWNDLGTEEMSGYYMNGVKHGPWKQLASGRLHSLMEYKQGKLVYRKDYPL